MVSAALLIAPPAAQAAFHLMKIREVHTGGPSGGSYVELQMWTSGQNFVGGHPIVVYNPDGSVKYSFSIPGNVANGDSQATVLIAGPGYSGPAADATDSGLDLPAAGGAVCFTQGTPPDCVSWGDFTGNASLPAPGAGTPASSGGVNPGMALHRSITPGCATLLEPNDDTDNSAADFSEESPNPRPNASAIVETACPLPPNTAIDTKPANPTKATSASFTYHAIPTTGASFECSLDGAAFSPCPNAGITYPGPLAEATHTFAVRAINSAGTDPTPATYTWKVNSTSPPETTILSKPPDPSESSTAAFTYSSNEPGSTFECALDGAGFTGCPVIGIIYMNLANGPHSFQVRATDGSANTDASPAGYSWAVAVPDSIQLPLMSPPLPIPPPDTKITRNPGATTRDRTPTFRFRATITPATFECKVDHGAFKACRSPFTTKKLTFGRHLVRVRAKAGGKVDPTPARSSFKVVKPKKKATKKRKRGG